MKYLIGLLFIFSSSLLYAQRNAEITEGLHLMSQGTHPAFSLKLESASANFILSQWKSFIKKYKGKTKFDKKLQEVFSDNAQLKNMSSNTVDVYARVVGNEEEGHLELLVWFNLGVNYLSSDNYPDRAQDAFLLLESFKSEIDKDLLKIAIKEEKKRIKEEEKNLKKMEKAIAKLDKAVAKYEEEIETIKLKIKEVEDDKLKVVEEMDAQKALIKEKEQKLLELEQELKSLKRK